MGNMLNDLLYKGRGGRRFFWRWLQRSVKGWSGRLASGQLGLETRFKLFFLVLSCAYSQQSADLLLCAWQANLQLLEAT